MMHRRSALGLLAGSFAAVALPNVARAVDEKPGRTGMGLVIYCRRFRQQILKQQHAGYDLYDPLRFLEHCYRLGAGGIQAALGVRDGEYAAGLRRQAERWGMYIEAIIRPPEAPNDVERFNAEMQTARRAAARTARTVIIPGRRYERFETLEEFREFAARGRRMLELAAPVAERHRLPLAVENHKDQRTIERIELFQRIGSEYVGACVDTGNSFALLEDARETVEGLAPWAFSVHLKDQAVKEYRDGFLLADVPLGRGIFDLKKLVDILRSRKPEVRFTLELITRDPLKVPCLTKKYWATLPDVPARDLARTLRTVRAGAAESLPEVETLPLAQQVAREEANIGESLKYAAEQLRI